ncbi:MAG TPA: hypothetical protein VNG35_02595 [Gemmatimonadales bacterium]|nr:hypothetical protein [Gemmatimonadales bacterium]
MIHQDIMVYAHPDGITYVGCFEGSWHRWPAVEQGWAARTHGTEAMAAGCEELEPRLARLALRLSGVPVCA